MRLGVATIDSKLSHTILDYSIKEKNSSILIKDKKGIDQVDGLIIPIVDKKQLASGIEWLLASQKNNKVFVWIFSKESLGEETNILRQLGANGIITNEENIQILFLSIKNIFDRIEYVNSSQIVYAKKFLNEQNQTVNVNGQSKVLTQKEFIILQILFDNKGNVVPYEVMMEHVWPNNQGKNIYRLANVIFHLRKKVEESKDFTITNISSKGYMLRL